MYLNKKKSEDLDYLKDKSDYLNSPYNLPYNLNLLLQPMKQVCGKNVGEDILLISFVLNRVSSFEVRNNIRKTWANKRQFPNLAVIFVVGISLNQKSNNFR